MDDPSRQQVVWGNPQYPSVAPSVSNNTTRPDGKLWGGNVRSIMGILQIIGGVIEIVLSIAVVIIPTYYFDHIDNIGWGIWTGVVFLFTVIYFRKIGTSFTIVTGSLGVWSLQKKGMVIAYMIMSIIAAALSAGCFTYAVIGTIAGTYPRSPANLASYIILCIIFLAQMVISIIGASFTCGAVCSTTNHPQQIVYYTPQPLSQQYVPSPPYAVAASQGGSTVETTVPSTNGDFVALKM